MDVFGQRMTVITDHLVAQEHAAALNEINQIIGKKKTFDKLSPRQKQVLTLVKSLCLCNTNAYGEAASLFEEFLGSYQKFDKDLASYSRMFVSTAIYLGKTAQAKKFCEEYFKSLPSTNPKDLEPFLNLCVADWDLTAIQQHYMKSFKNSNKPADCLASIYVQYLHLRREGAEYLKKPDIGKLKILKMFIPKLEKLISEETDANLKTLLRGQLVFLKHNLYKDSEEYEELFSNIKANLDVFEFSEHIDTLAELVEDDLVWNKLSNEIVSLFLEILQSQLRDNTIANYNMQKRFLTAMNKRIDAKHLEHSLHVLKEQRVSSVESLIHAFEHMDSSHFMLRYLKVLAEYLSRFVVKNQDKFRSKNYLILTLDVFRCLTVSGGEAAHVVLEPAIREFVATAIGYYKNTLTLVDELQHLVLDDPRFRTIVGEEIDKVMAVNPTDNNLNCSLGYQRMLVEACANDLDSVDEHKCLDLANQYLKEFDRFDQIYYKDKPKIDIEKGDRLANDNYLLAAVEIFRIIQNKQCDPVHQLKYRQVLFILLEFSKRSPYNFDLMIRDLEVNNMLGFFEENHDLFLKHDLKGNQFDTLAYLFYKIADNVPVAPLAAEVNSSSLHFYRECQKETVESFNGCCKHANFKVLWEFYLYERLNANSVHRVIVDMILAEQLVASLDPKSNQYEANLINANHLLSTNLEKLTQKNCKLAFNFDLVQCQLPRCFTRNIFNFDLIGPLKDINVLRAECKVLGMMVKYLKQEKVALEDISSLMADVEAVGVHNLLSFDQYFVFRRVNNPTTNLTATHAYGKRDLDWQMRIVKVGLEALAEFAMVAAVLADESEQSTLSIENSLSLPKLEALKVELEKSIPQLCIPKHAAIDSQAYFAVFHLLHKLRLLAAVVAVTGKDLKSASKRKSKAWSETDKDTLSRCVQAFLQVRDYAKERIKQADQVFEQHRTDLELKSDLSDIAWPSAIKEAMPRLLARYSDNFKSCLISSQSRLTAIKKSLNQLLEYLTTAIQLQISRVADHALIQGHSPPLSRLLQLADQTS